MAAGFALAARPAGRMPGSLPGPETGVRGGARQISNPSDPGWSRGVMSAAPCGVCDLPAVIGVIRHDFRRFGGPWPGPATRSTRYGSRTSPFRKLRK